MAIIVTDGPSVTHAIPLSVTGHFHWAFPVVATHSQNCLLQYVTSGVEGAGLVPWVGSPLLDGSFGLRKHSEARPSWKRYYTM